MCDIFLVKTSWILFCSRVEHFLVHESITKFIVVAMLILMFPRSKVNVILKYLFIIMCNMIVAHFILIINNLYPKFYFILFSAVSLFFFLLWKQNLHRNFCKLS